MQNCLLMCALLRFSGSYYSTGDWGRQGDCGGFEVANCGLKILGELDPALRIDYLLNAVPDGLAKRNGMHLDCITDKKKCFLKRGDAAEFPVFDLGNVLLRHTDFVS